MENNFTDRILSRTIPINDCIVWIGCVTHDGYGQIKNKKTQRIIYVHRAIYEDKYGKIPKGLFIDHLCRNRACVNIKHFDLVTRKENTLRGFGKAAINKRKKYCKRGHEFTKENTYSRPNGLGWRECNICRKMLAKKWRIKKGREV